MQVGRSRLCKRHSVLNAPLTPVPPHHMQQHIQRCRKITAHAAPADVARATISSRPVLDSWHHPCRALPALQDRMSKSQTAIVEENIPKVGSSGQEQNRQSRLPDTAPQMPSTQPRQALCGRTYIRATDWHGTRPVLIFLYAKSLGCLADHLARRLRGRYSRHLRRSASTTVRNV